MAAPAAAPTSTPGPVSQVYTWEPSNAVIAARYGLRPSDILRFDLNTSPLPSPDLAAALAGPFDPPLNEYPDSMYIDVAEAAAAYVGVDPSQILVGAGADEVLDIIAKTFLPAGGRAVVPIPTYSMYGVLSTQRGATLDAVLRRPADQGFGIDLDRMLPRLAGANLVWLCAPNNPTGAPEPIAVIEQVLDAAAALGGQAPMVIVDEAYAEFSPETSISLIDRYPGLVVVRTVSKAFALAGMRVGYGVAQRPTIERLERLRPPGSVSTVSAAVAAVALRNPGQGRRNAADLGRERDWLAARLADLGLPAYPSITNFLLVSIGTVDAAEDLTEVLLRAGIVTRTFGPANPLRGHLRLTVRTRAEDERLLDVLRTWQAGRDA
jgi:histidinol-phosphate aminotransferase